MRNEIIEKLRDPNIAGGVVEAGNAEDIVRILGEAQMEITPEEAAEILEGKKRLVVGAISSLSEDKLSEIAGGGKILDVLGTPARKVGGAIHGGDEVKGKAERESAREKVGGFISDHPLATEGVVAGAAAGTVALAIGAGFGIKKLIDKKRATGK